jgi:hypothetical protein
MSGGAYFDAAAGSPVQTWTVYDGANAYADFDGSGNVTARYLYGPGVDQILARTDGSGATVWYLTDGLGSVRAIADVGLPLEEVVDIISYDPYGNVLSESNPSVGDRFKFTAREYNLDAGRVQKRCLLSSPRKLQPGNRL